MNLPIPILRNHDPSAVIGKATPENGKLVIEFTQEAGVTMDMALAAFGSFCVLASFVPDNGQVVLLKVELYAFSVGDGK